MEFKRREIAQLLVAWLALSLMFSLSLTPVGYKGAAYSLLIVGTAFVLHELSHKFVAQNFGRSAEFRIWWSGIALGMIMALGTYLAFGPSGVFFFAAPGAVYVSPLFTGYGYPFNPKGFMRGEGLISFAGPAINLVLGILFRVLAVFVHDTSAVLFLRVSSINVFLGFFNMLPIPPLDGQKVYGWNRIVWASSTLLLFLLLVLGNL